jgi:uncharacterized glyoxalase superfamily protein PhnB
VSVTAVIAQLRTTDLEGSIRFWTEAVGFKLDFVYGDFYAGIRTGLHVFHLKHADRPDPSIADVEANGHFHLYIDTDDAQAMVDTLAARGIHPVTTLHETGWGTREFRIFDDQGHTIYFGERL